MSYPGGKAGSGVYQAIINQMPPHDVYIEPFAGAGGVMRNKRAAKVNIAIDLSDEAEALWREITSVTFLKGCGIQYLARHHFNGSELVYCDPPYLMAARRSQRAMYDHELGDIDHAWLLDILRGLPCNVIISGYASDLYDQMLDGWRKITFQATTRQGVATETLWMNFPEPVLLHDYSYLGENFRERERIKRKVGRWKNNLAALPAVERQAILSALAEVASADQAVSDSRIAINDAAGQHEKPGEDQAA